MFPLTDVVTQSFDNVNDKLYTYAAHGVGRVVGALGSQAGFAGSMLN